MEFDKYDAGAYHWDITHDASFLSGYSPRLAARYTLPLRFLDRRHELGESLGLDVGCGDGAFLQYLSKAGGRAIGVDLSMNSLQLYRERADDERLEVAQANTYNLPFDSTFDFVTMLDVIEHLTNVKEAVTELARLTADGGTCIITTPIKGGETTSEYHVEEFTPEGIYNILSAFFSEVSVYGYGKESVLRRYDQSFVLRQCCKLASRVGVNPFTFFEAEPPMDEYRYQLAVATK